MRKLNINNSKINFILISISLTLWLQSLVHAGQELTIRGFGDLGLITIMPITHLVAIAILTISFIITIMADKKSEKLLFIHIFILILYLFASATIIDSIIAGPGSRMRWAYMNYGFADYVIRNDILNPRLIWYHNWPVFIIYIALLNIVSSLSTATIINSFPLFPNLLFLIPLYAIMKNLANSINQTWLSIWIFYIANWIGQDYLSPQCFAFFIYLVLSLILFKFFLVYENQGLAFSRLSEISAVIIILFASLAFGHMLTSIIFIDIFVTMYILKMHNRSPLLLLLSIILVSWISYGAILYFEKFFAYFISESLNFDLIFARNIGSRTHGSPGHILVTMIMLSYSALIFLMALIGYYISRIQNININKNNAIAIILISISFVAGLVSYGGEVVMRVYFFSLILLAYLGSYLILSKRTFIIFMIFLIAIAPTLNIISTYGNEKMQYISPGEIMGADFLYENADKGYIVGGYPWSVYKFSGDVYNTVFYWRANESFSNYQKIMLEKVNISPLYLLVIDGDRTRYQLRTDTSSEEFDLYHRKVDSSKSYIKIYSNPKFDVYSNS